MINDLMQIGIITATVIGVVYAIDNVEGFGGAGALLMLLVVGIIINNCNK